MKLHQKYNYLGNILYALLFSLICVVIYFFSQTGKIYELVGSDMLMSLDIKASDSLTQKAKLPHPDIYVIGIDEASLREIGAWNSWNRGIMADMINTLNKDPNAKPAVIGIDVSYFSETLPIYDDALAKAAKDGGNVVVACEAVFADILKYDENGLPYISKTEITNIDYPYPALKSASTQGIINTLPETDGAIRNCIVHLDSGTTSLNSFSYEIYKKYAEKLGLSTSFNVPLDSLGRTHLSYSAKSGDYYGGNSFVKVLKGEIPASIFADTIVLIGPYATGMMDQYYTPLEHGKLMYGVEIHGNMIQALIEQNFKTSVSLITQCLILFLASFLAFMVFSNLDLRLSTVVLFMGASFYLLMVSETYKSGYIINTIYLPLSLSVFYIYFMIRSYLDERNRRQTVTNTFKRYMEPSVVEHLLNDDDAQSNMTGIKRDIAVLFVDIRGFTPMSENLDAGDVVGILNEYLTLTSSTIFSNKGTVDKFIGDATMAIFNAPLDLDDYTFRAVKTAFELKQHSKELGEHLMKKYGRSVSFGIGVNCGDAIVGNIGADFRMDYTAIGDTVNTAARLEGSAKPNQILISSAVYERVKDRITANEIGNLTFKGKSIEVFTYEVLDIKTSPDLQ